MWFYSIRACAIDCKLQNKKNNKNYTQNIFHIVLTNLVPFPFQKNIIQRQQCTKGQKSV